MVAAVAMSGVRPLPAGDGLGEVELEIGRASQAFKHVTVCGLGQRALERVTGGPGVARPQRGATFGDQSLDRHGHASIIAWPG